MKILQAIYLIASKLRCPFCNINLIDGNHRILKALFGTKNYECKNCTFELCRHDSGNLTIRWIYNGLCCGIDNSLYDFDFTIWNQKDERIFYFSLKDNRIKEAKKYNWAIEDNDLNSFTDLEILINRLIKQQVFQ